MRVFRRLKFQRHIRRFVLLLAVAPLPSCDLLTDPFDSWREKPEAVTVEASVDGLTITVTWTAAAHTYRYRVELFENPPGRGPWGATGLACRKARAGVSREGFALGARQVVGAAVVCPGDVSYVSEGASTRSVHRR